MPRFHCHPMEERNQCTHFSPLHKSVCAWLHGDFPSLLLTATVPCPLPPPKGTLSPTQLISMCFTNEQHGLPGLAACTPCCLHPQSPGMALVRQAGPAGPGDRGRAGFCGAVLTAEPPHCSTHGAGQGHLEGCEGHMAENMRGCRNDTRPFVLVGLFWVLGVLSRAVYKPGQRYLLPRGLSLLRVRILILKADTACV